MSGQKRKIESLDSTEGEEEEKAQPPAKKPCVVEEKKMPRTAGLADDVFIEVRQEGTTWTPQAVSMKYLRRTQSAFLDEAIQIEERRLDIPAGTLPTQVDFINLWTDELKWSCSAPKSEVLMEAWDRLGFHAKVEKFIDQLRPQSLDATRGGVWALKVFRWARRFKKPALAQKAVLALANTKRDDELTPEMIPELAALLRRCITAVVSVHKELDEFEATAYDTRDCDPDVCTKSCSRGDRCAGHPQGERLSGTDEDYDGESLAFFKCIDEELEKLSKEIGLGLY